MLSLKHVMPNASISLIVDDATDKITNTFFCSIKTLITEYKVISLPTEMSATAKSRYIKTSMRQYIDGNFLYVDSDTIWASPINEEDFTFDIMGVLDGNCLLKDNPVLDYIQSVRKKTGFNSESNYYINGGVLYSKDSEFSHNFFKKWHNYWEKSSKSGCYVDQPSLNKLIEEEFDPQKSLLPGTYNAQITFSWDYFFNAKIIHYFTYSIENGKDFEEPYLLKNKEFWQKVSQTGITAEIQEIIKNPLKAFQKGILIIGEKEAKLTRTRLYNFIKDLYIRKVRDEKSRFDLLEKMLSLITKR
ncbi:hypothetical protein IKQ19_11580 [Candidatus Saccharibacteria bacterium]|nr:hypothetical protein [Candidatus Saccharibacteria bacterium]